MSKAAGTLELGHLGVSAAVGGIFSKEAGSQMLQVVEMMRHAMDSRPREACREEGGVFKVLAGLGAKVVKL